MKTLTREEISELLVGSVEFEEPSDLSKETAIVYTMADGRTYAQLVKPDGKHEQYRVTEEVAEAIKAKEKDFSKLTEIKSLIKAEKLKPKVEFPEYAHKVEKPVIEYAVIVEEGAVE